MSTMSLVELLTGKSFELPPERLDMQGLVAAFRAYNDALPEDQVAMQFGLAESILKLEDWGSIADSIYLARSLQMSHQLLRTAINTASLFVQKPHLELIRGESRRYFRQVSQELPPADSRDLSPDAAKGSSRPLSDEEEWGRFEDSNGTVSQWPSSSFLPEMALEA